MAFPTPLWTSLPTNPMIPPTTAASSRPVTRDGQSASQQHQQPPPTPTLLTKDRERKSSTYSRRASFSSQRRRASSIATSPDTVVTDATAPPALPYYALAAAAKVASQQAREQGTASPSAELLRSPTFPEVPGNGWGPKMLSRTTTNTSNGERPPTTPGGSLSGSGFWAQHEAQAMHNQVVELATKRINFLDYLRKAHEGRRYWFNTYLFDKPDLSRMPIFDPRKLSRKATNYLLLGVSLPVVVDLYSANASEFVRSLNLLLAEYDSFQQLHNDSASRNRIPNMFRRPGVKSRRSTSNTDVHSIAEDSLGGPSPGGLNTAPASVMNFAASESDLFPGEEYTHLLTPALPFEPDYFETFATLCDVLIDCYTRLLDLLPTPRECPPSLAEQFSKMDSKIKKLIFQGVVKEFEDHSRSNVKTEVANIGKVVLSGLM